MGTATGPAGQDAVPTRTSWRTSRICIGHSSRQPSREPHKLARLTPGRPAPPGRTRRAAREGGDPGRLGRASAQLPCGARKEHVFHGAGEPRRGTAADQLPLRPGGGRHRQLQRDPGGGRAVTGSSPREAAGRAAPGCGSGRGGPAVVRHGTRLARAHGARGAARRPAAGPPDSPRGTHRPGRPGGTVRPARAAATRPGSPAGGGRPTGSGTDRATGSGAHGAGVDARRRPAGTAQWRLHGAPAPGAPLRGAGRVRHRRDGTAPLPRPEQVGHPAQTRRRGRLVVPSHGAVRPARRHGPVPALAERGRPCGGPDRHRSRGAVAPTPMGGTRRVPDPGPPPPARRPRPADRRRHLRPTTGPRPADPHGHLQPTTGPTTH